MSNIQVNMSVDNVLLLENNTYKAEVFASFDIAEFSINSTLAIDFNFCINRFNQYNANLDLNFVYFNATSEEITSNQDILSEAKKYLIENLNIEIFKSKLAECLTVEVLQTEFKKLGNDLMQCSFVVSSKNL